MYQAICSSLGLAVDEVLITIKNEEGALPVVGLDRHRKEVHIEFYMVCNQNVEWETEPWDEYHYFNDLLRIQELMMFIDK